MHTPNAATSAQRKGIGREATSVHLWTLVPMLVLLVGASSARAERVPTKAGASSTDLARALASLRGDIESLSAKIDAERSGRRGRVRALEAQKGDLDMELRREQLALTQLKDKLAKEKAKLAQAAAQQASLRPAVLTAIATLRATVAQTLPYRRDERLASLDELTARIGASKTTPAKALVRLWEQAEDEMRLGRESALDRQVIALPNGGEALVDVIKVGMVGMYYQASETEVGRLVRSPDGGYAWEAIVGEAEIRQVTALFDAFNKRIRAGFFEVPAALVGVLK